MNTADWLMLMCLALGWMLWRKPNLKYKGVNDVVN